MSIVMPASNPRADWLRQALESALGDDAPIEVLLVDDGSEPPVADLVDLDDPRLRLLRLPHGGVARARNAGIAVARGTFVRFADADDVLEPGSTMRLLYLARGGAIAYGETLVCDETLAPQKTRGSELSGRVARECLLGRFDVRLPALLFPRKVVAAVGDWDPEFAICSDWDYVLRALDHAPVAGTRDVVARYRRHGSSLTRSADPFVAERAWTRVVDGYFTRHPEQRGALERAARAMVALNWAGARAYAGDWRGAAKRLLSGFRFAPVAAARRLPAVAAALVTARRR